MIEHKIGDLLESDEPVIAHGCNTVGVMGAGIARAIHLKWGTAKIYEPYEWACSTGEFITGSAQRVDVGDKIVYNLGTQRDPGRNARYWWVMLAMANMFERMATFGEARVAIPRIGCGIGGLEWEMVEDTIRTVQEHTESPPLVVVYTHPSEAHKR